MTSGSPSNGSSAIPTSLGLETLRFDPLNPRLPAEMQGATDHDLLLFIAETYDAIEVARSIARYGFFTSEPLIALRQADNEYIVVEGNRRLAALRLLDDSSFAEELADAEEWVSLSESAILPDTIPVVVAPNRDSVAPIIGFRHIAGIEPWDPYAKARFIASLVSGGKSLDDVADIVGERPADVATHYRNHEIVRVARDDFHIDTSRAEDRFGVFTRAMQSLPLRIYIGAPSPSEVRVGRSPLSKEDASRFAQLLSWVFGDDQHSAVIDESRRITDLGRAVESDEGRQVLEETRDLEQAVIAAGGIRDRLLLRLGRAHSNLSAAHLDLLEYVDDEEVREKLAEIQAELQLLLDELDGD